MQEEHDTEMLNTMATQQLQTINKMKKWVAQKCFHMQYLAPSLYRSIN